ncbi:MAG TPA: nuclear transport factor 2 family protein [Baekduia sp.]|nr:nuclear transport factor 2 family protein [Baekduia sp.]
MTANDVAEIGDIIQRWIQAFCVVDADTMKTFWPRDYADIVYQSEENQHALSSYDEIAAYWDHVPSTLESIPAVEDADVRIHLHGNDIATVYLYAMASAKFPGAERLYRAPFRACIVLRRLDGAWKFIHYHESRVLDLQRVTDALNAGEDEVLAYGATHA